MEHSQKQRARSTMPESANAMNNWFNEDRALCVANVQGKGRGVIANVAFREHDVIESTPAWGFDGADAALVDQTRAFEYYFVRNDRDNNTEKIKGYLVFGLISIVNHSSTPNTRIFWEDRDTGPWACIAAIRDISPGEELTHRYTNVSSYNPNIVFVD